MCAVPSEGGLTLLNRWYLRRTVQKQWRSSTITDFSLSMCNSTTVGGDMPHTNKASWWLTQLEIGMLLPLTI